MKLRADICLLAVLGVAVLCKTGDGGKAPAAVSDFCEIAGPQVAKLKQLSEAEIAALARPRKEAIATLRRQHKRLCT